MLYLFTSHVVFDLFTFGEHKILYNRDKFSYDTTVGITFQTDKKIPVKFLEIIFKNNKQKHYPLIISWNLHILMKSIFIDICIFIIFHKKNYFPVIARDLIFHLKQTAVSILQKQLSRDALSVNKVFLKIWKISQENTCVGVSF